ncbi:YciI family protein [Nocardioides sp. LHG3406-4]|uniref:YciI family protein n=1 Tax=Nocardioides sp. LHG3406-4 TaxID=2804575 RepID=UPI003CF41F2F
MRFLVLLNEDDPTAWERASEEQRQAVFDGHATFDAALEERGALVVAEALAGAAEARGVRDGVVTEGPFAESAEQLVGFYLVDLESMEAAVDLATLLSPGYTIEVRPVTSVEGYDG